MMRIMLEAMCYENNSFITLTYEDDRLPDGNSLCKRDLQNFFKRFRYYYKFNKVRYFAVGEYGDVSFRPHYHVIIFNYQSEKLFVDKSWSKGFSSVFEFSKAFARYITGYCIKKMNKKDDERLGGKEPEFSLSSRRDGGIGSTFIDRMIERLNSKDYYKKSYITTIRIGGKDLYLGRYLSERLNRGINSDENEKDLAFYEYQNEIFDSVIDGIHIGNKFNEVYGDRIKAMEKRHKIYKVRKKL